MSCVPHPFAGLRIRHPLLVLLAVSFISALVTGSSHAATPGPWITLFNGKDLTGWTVPTPNLHWRVENGVLISESDEKLTGSMLWTERKNFGDFILELDVRWKGDPDSGVFMRTPAVQVQVGTSISRKVELTGSFYLPPEGYPEHAKPGRRRSS